MSGFTERVIEDWLTSSDERAYQLSFATALSRLRYKIKYVSSHTTLEHGKDIIALSPKRELVAYQLKAGNISLPAWRKISDEVRDCARIPVQVPGVRPRLPDRAVLVLSGRITDAVRDQIGLVNQEHQTRGYPAIETVELDELVADFTQVFETFFPASIAGLHALLRLYLADGRGPQNKADLFAVLENVIGKPSGKTTGVRALSNLIVAAEFAASTFRKSQNHISVLDTWTIAACHVLLLRKKLSLTSRSCAQALSFCREGVEEAGSALLAEGLARDDFVEGDPLIDGMFLPARRTTVLGYMGAEINSRCLQGKDTREESNKLLQVLQREAPIGPWGEGSWNYQLNVALAIQATPTGALVSEVIMRNWLPYVCPEESPSPPDVYSTVEDHLSIRLQRERALEPDVDRHRLSYTSASAIGFLARRNLRSALARTWRNVSRYDFAEFVPSEQEDLLKWRSDAGALEFRQIPIEGSWKSIRRQAVAERCTLFEDEQSWLLPYFLCTFPHRVSPGLTGELDYKTAPEPLRREWARAAT